MKTRRLGKTNLQVSDAPAHACRGEWPGAPPRTRKPTGIALINKFYDLATMQPEVPATVQSHYELLEKTASACIDCHACESRCPFGVKIDERMKKTAELFGC